MSGWLTIVILTSIFIISFIMFKGYETITALRTSSFITSILAVLFFSVGMLTQSVLIIFVVFTGLLVLYDLLRKE